MNLGASDADNLGISVISSTSFTADRGLMSSMYDFGKLACGDLRSVHLMPEGKALLAFGTTWTKATADSTGFTAFTPRLNPTFFVVSPDNPGSLEPVTDRSGEPGQMWARQTDPTTMRLVGGASNGDWITYLRTRASGDPVLTTYETGRGVVEWRHTENLPAQFSSPNSETVVWDRGVDTFNENHLIVFGSGQSTGTLYAMLIRIGTWEPFYGNGKGFVANPSELRPLMSKNGTPLSSLGSVTFRTERGLYFISTCYSVGDQVYGSIWRGLTSMFGRFEQLAIATPLGLTTDDSFLGGGLRLHPLHPNPSNSKLASPTVRSGLPYSWSVRSSTKITTAWDLQPVLRLGS